MEWGPPQKIRSTILAKSLQVFAKIVDLIFCGGQVLVECRFRQLQRRQISNRLLPTYETWFYLS